MNKEVTETQLAYIAGILDGEGTLIVGKYRKKGNRDFAYRGFMAITNTHIPLLEFIQGAVSGRIAVQRRVYKGCPNSCYALYFSTNLIRLWLPRLLPYLVAKKNQAEVLLAFLERQQQSSFGPVTPENLAFYEECYQRLKQMKKVRYAYEGRLVAIAQKHCAQCGKDFTVFSSSPQKIYCSDYCSRKTHWTRSNRRVATGTPAWAMLLQH